MKKKVKKEENINRILSKVLATGEIMETIWDRTQPESYLALCKDNDVEIVESYKDDDEVEWFPFDANNPLIAKGFVKLPSALGNYKEIKDLYNEISDFTKEFMSLPDEFVCISSVYIMFTWVYDRFHSVPYLRVIGDFGTGKSRFKDVIGNLCYKPMFASGSISTAAIFRTIDQIGGTTILDEADFRSSDMWTMIVKILNDGNSKGSPTIRMKVNKKDNEMTPEFFNVFGPKILASRERFSDEALESRCLTQRLWPIKKVAKPIHLPNDFEERAILIRNKLLMYRFKNFHDISANEDTLKDIDFPRLKQSALGLTSVASKIDDEILDKCLSFLKKYEAELQQNIRHDVMADVLSCVLDLIKESQGVGGLFAKIRIGKVAKRFDEKFYDEYSNKYRFYQLDNGYSGKKQTELVGARQVGAYIKKMGIFTDQDSEGRFISIPKELDKIKALAERYGFDLEEDIPF